MSPGRSMSGLFRHTRQERVQGAGGVRGILARAVRRRSEVGWFSGVSLQGFRFLFFTLLDV